MDKKIRVFLAIEIPKELKESISELQKFLKKSNADANWVPAENFHYNLKFFGWTTEDEIKKLISITEKTASKAKSFEIEIKGTGGFPSLNSPRVLWLGMSKGTNQIKELAEKLDLEYSKIGIPKEEREFKAHLTLCRIKSNDNKKALVDKAKQKQHINIGTFKAEELVLFSSKLTRKGPIYEPIKRFRLG